MKKFLSRLGLVVLSLFVIGSSYPVHAAPVSQVMDVQILAINDFHGALNTTGSVTVNGTRLGYAGQASVLAAYLNQESEAFLAANPDGQSVRVQSGDMVGASPAVSGLLQDEPTIKALAEMGFSIGTLGNHEFDEGLTEFNRIINGEAPNVGDFDEIVDSYDRVASGQKIVIANLVDKQGEIPFGWQPYTIETYVSNGKEYKVGYIGVVTTEIPNLVLKKYHEDYVVSDEAEAIAKYSKILQETHGVNAIVVLAHCPTTTDAAGNVFGDVAKIIDRTFEIYPETSIDVVIAGHNHVYANGIHHNVRVVQSISQGKAFSNITGQIDFDTQDFVTTPNAEVIPTLVDSNNNPADVTLVTDPVVKDIVDEANAIIQPIANAKISEADMSVVVENKITRSTNEHRESPVGNLVTDGQLAIARKTYPDVDFAMTNNGGIRADLIVADDGSITWGSAQAVQPFGNILQVVEMSGQQIVDALNQQYDNGQNYFLQISGLRYTYIDSENPLLVYEVKDVYTENGEFLDLNATYQVVINDFLFGGGDEFSAFTGATLIGAIDPDTETFVQYLKDLNASETLVSAKVEGRKLYDTNVDKTQLNDLIKEVESLDLNDFTLETRVILLEKLANAKAVSTDILTTIEAVETAVSELLEAKNNLILVKKTIELVDDTTGVKVIFTTDDFTTNPTLVVKEVEYKIDGQKTLAYDISFMIDDVLVQPKNAIEVILPAGTLDTSKVKLYHIGDNGPDAVTITKVTDTHVHFSGTDFSTYVLAQANTVIPNTGVDSSTLWIAGVMAMCGFIGISVLEIKRRRH